MPRRCAVPYCNTGRKAENAKLSVFRVPNDTVMCQKWEEAIPGNVKLGGSQVICEKHFDENAIAREWIKCDSNGQIIARVRYKHARLNDFAIPSKFVHDSPAKENGNFLHDYARSNGDGIHLPLTEKSVDLSTNSVDIDPHNQSGASVESATFMKPSTQVISTSREEFPETENISSCVASPALDDTPLPSRMDANSLEADLYAHQMPFKIISHVAVSERIREDGVSSFTDSTIIVPESWNITELSIENKKRILFSYVITKLDNGVHCPLTEKYVTLDADRSLNYFVYGRHVKQEIFNFDRVLNTIGMLPSILTTFMKAPICIGLGDVNICFMLIGETYHDCTGKWRSKDCRLVCKQKRCASCVKMRKLTLQRKARQRQNLRLMNTCTNSRSRRKNK